jgi:tRNA U34 5-methylaminomethyl-2-thiouridine-forming methyltransferase MnmC
MNSFHIWIISILKSRGNVSSGKMGCKGICESFHNLSSLCPRTAIGFDRSANGPCAGLPNRQKCGVPSPSGYELVKLAGGAYSVRSLAHDETFHPVIGPVAEAEALYLNQLGLRDRLQRHAGEFVLWDVGLGAAANALTVLRATKDLPATIHLLSFDHTPEPLTFALKHTTELDYLTGYEPGLEALLATRQAHFSNETQTVRWADFPSFLQAPSAEKLAKPHAIMFDAFSPAKNPAMWTAPLFARLFQLLDPARPCALPTYSRSTMLRVTLLLAGFFVGVGHPTGEKEETTIAANAFELITEPLDRKWLERAHRSSSAEPLWTADYRQRKISPETYEKLRLHPQFR